MEEKEEERKRREKEEEEKVEAKRGQGGTFLIYLVVCTLIGLAGLFFFLLIVWIGFH